MIFMPPGSGKSVYTTVMFPVWLMMNKGATEDHNEGIKIIGASHTADLAENFSKKIQKLIAEVAEFTDFNLLTYAVDIWETTNGCEYKTAGVGGSITGHRADCVKAGTIVQTLSGDIPIEDIAIGTKTGYVLSYDENAKMPVYKRVVAIARRETKEIWRIRTESGNLVEATGNHRFHNGRGWTPAASLAVGDVLLRGLRKPEKFARSSYKHERIGQSMVEFGDSVRFMSHDVACGGAIRTESDSVEMVERVCESAVVYDIQVEGTECFFANGILVHNCGIIDDPVKSRKDAESPTFRKTARDWHNADFRTRLKPGAPEIIIQTRWHEDDLAGQLLRDEGEDWTVLCLPAIAGVFNESTGEWEEGEKPDPLGRKPGAFLWEDDDYGYADDIRKKMNRSGAKDYWSLYMQQPRPMTGGIFKTNNIVILDALPKGPMQFVRGWDLAATAETGSTTPAATAGALLAKDREGRFYVIDMEVIRGGPDEVESTILATASRDTRLVPISLPQDPGQAGKVQVLYLARKLAGYKVHTSPESGDKATRAAPFAAQLNVGNVYLIRAEWNKDFIEELKSFPNGKFKDMVDASSRAFNYLVSAVATERFEALAS